MACNNDFLGLGYEKQFWRIKRILAIVYIWSKHLWKIGKPAHLGRRRCAGWVSIHAHQVKCTPCGNNSGSPPLVTARTNFSLRRMYKNGRVRLGNLWSNKKERREHWKCPTSPPLLPVRALVPGSSCAHWHRIQVMRAYSRMQGTIAKGIYHTK
jgi:hypothetical protein